MDLASCAGDFLCLGGTGDPEGRLGAPGALKGGPMGDQNDPLELKNLYCFSI